MKKKLILLFLVCTLVFCTLLGGCYRDSIEYKYDIERFDGKYRTFSEHGIEHYIDITINDYVPEGFSGEFKVMLFGEITPEGYDWLPDNVVEFREVKLDAQLVEAINDMIDMIGDEVQVKKDEIYFKDSDTTFTYKESYYEEGFGLRTQLNIKNDIIRAFTDMSYYGNKKIIRFFFAFNAEATDGTEYEIYIAAFKKK